MQAETPLNRRVDSVIRRLRDAGLDPGPLEALRSTAYTSSSEWLGELGLAIREVGRQRIDDRAIRVELGEILAEVRRVWPGM